MSVYLTGKVMDVYYTENNGIKVKLKVPGEEGFFSYPTVFLDVTNDTKKIQKKNVIKLRGFFVNLRRSTGNIYQKVFAFNVAPSTDEFENKVIAEGEVKKIYTRGRPSIDIETIDGVIVEGKPECPLDDFKEGDFIRLTGRMATELIKTEDDKQIIHEHFIVDEIEKIERG